MKAPTQKQQRPNLHRRLATICGVRYHMMPREKKQQLQRHVRVRARRNEIARQLVEAA